MNNTSWALSGSQPNSQGLSDSFAPSEGYGDYAHDFEWPVNGDAGSLNSFSDPGFTANLGYIQPYTIEMSPYDMLRSILQDSRSDDELEQILEANGYDLGQTINYIMESHGLTHNTIAMQPEPTQRTFLIGKNMSPASRPVTPATQLKSPIVCRYWLASGHCARADCRYSHEVQNHICKYWVQGNCMAGNACLFSHDPALLMQQLAFAESGPGTPQQFTPNFQLQDYDSFPALQPTTSNPYEDSSHLDASNLTAALKNQQALLQQPPGLFPSLVPTGPRYPSRSHSRPNSRHTSRAATPSQPNIQDDQAFPTLGSAAAAKPSKRHQGKRGGHGYTVSPGSQNAQPNNLADVVRMSPSPGPNSREAMKRGLRNNRSFFSTREHNAAAMEIPAPVDVPWLETGSAANQAYLRARQEACKHGGLRNKFLQSAAQAWNRNDARGAKALSLRGQNENSLMREKHREAAQALYEERNKNASASKELYVDLHGLHPDEAVSYLSECLKDQKDSRRPLYAICGTGHHSKNGKDKIGKAVRAHLVEWRYAFQEFSVPGDRNNAGGILGIDPSSFDKEMLKRAINPSRAHGDGDSGVGFDEAKREDTKVQVVKEDPRVKEDNTVM